MLCRCIYVKRLSNSCNEDQLSTHILLPVKVNKDYFSKVLQFSKNQKLLVQRNESLQHLCLSRCCQKLCHIFDCVSTSLTFHALPGSHFFTISFFRVCRPVTKLNFGMTEFEALRNEIAILPHIIILSYCWRFLLTLRALCFEIFVHCYLKDACHNSFFRPNAQIIKYL